MDLILAQVYEFLIGVALGGGLSFFYACYRLQFHSEHYSRRQLLVTDSLWWLFAAVMTVGALFVLKWGALRAMFFLWLFLGFILGYTFLWRPLCRKVKAILGGKPKPPLSQGARAAISLRGTKKDAAKKEDSLLYQPFDWVAEGLYQSYTYGKQHYQAAKKKQQAVTEKWKKQVTAEKQKLKHTILTALWPEQKQSETEEADDPADDLMEDDFPEEEKNK